MASKKSKRPPADLPPTSLTSVQVDVTTRLGALTQATTTGLRNLDELLGGGLRTGTHLLVSGAPGVGKTALALMLAYMAARARAGVIYASVSLDDTEVMARLAARALHREYANVDATYGMIWSGRAMQDAALRQPIGACLDSVIKKVGNLLHLHHAKPMETTAAVASRAAYLWARHERVVIVIDGIEAFSASGTGSTQSALMANASYEGRLSQVAYELSALANAGCAVVTTCQHVNVQHAAPAATVAGELRPVRGARAVHSALPGLERRSVDLTIIKNRTGPTATLPLAYFAAASVFEERSPP